MHAPCDERLKHAVEPAAVEYVTEPVDESITFPVAEDMGHRRIDDRLKTKGLLSETSRG